MQLSNSVAKGERYRASEEAGKLLMNQHETSRRQPAWASGAPAAERVRDSYFPFLFPAGKNPFLAEVLGEEETGSGSPRKQ